MRKHPPLRRPTSLRQRTAGTLAAGFLAAWQQLLNGKFRPALGGTARMQTARAVDAGFARPHLSLPEWCRHARPTFLPTLRCGAGRDSSWAERRARLLWQVFADLLRRVLRPRATRLRQPEAFWRGCCRRTRNPENRFSVSLFRTAIAEAFR